MDVQKSLAYGQNLFGLPIILYKSIIIHGIFCRKGALTGAFFNVNIYDISSGY